MKFKKKYLDKLRKVVDESKLFNEIFYLKEYSDARVSALSALDHYCRIGILENRKPNSKFDPDWYFEEYTDVKESGVIPFDHFIRYGKMEGRLQNATEKQMYNELRIPGNFHVEDYRNAYDDLRELGEDFDYIFHYVRYGHDEGRVIIPQETAINTSRMSSGGQEAAESIHYETCRVSDDSSAPDNFELTGQLQQDFDVEDISQAIECVFDSEYYLKNNLDVAEAGVDPEWHYYTNGEKEGRKPNPFFDPFFYCHLNADVRQAGISAFNHYRDFGASESRLGMQPGLPGRKRMKNTKPLLFVGHDGIQAGSEVVLLEVIKWFYENTNRRIKLLLLAPGPLADKYAHYADVYALPNYIVDDGEKLRSFLKESFEFIYLNTVVTGRLFNLIEPFDINLQGDIVTHIHEMEKILAEHEQEMQNLLNQTKVWISASPASSDTLKTKYQIENDTVITVPAFINPVAEANVQKNRYQQEARQALDLNENAFVVSGCGTIYWRKGADLFIEAARKIKAQTLQKCEFVWLGDGPDKQELTDLLTEEEKKYIKFVGNRTDANKMLAAADVFLLSSREDPFPLVVLESAQHGIPTVCFSPATGITSFIEQDAGISVPDINAEQAADAILSLITDKTRLQQLGQTAKQKLFANYTTDQQNIKIYQTIKKHLNYQPAVTVIVPFYNHSKFIEERLDSILNQQIKDIEIIAMDDCSTDNTVEKVKRYLTDSRIRLIENESNSGSPFKQWEKGIAQANAKVVWIAEGDDTCDPSFLGTLLPYFNDPMVNIVSAKTEIIDENGQLVPDALKPYLDMAFPDKFNQSYLKDGFVEVNEQLGAMCTLVNASGLLIRKSSFGKALHQAHTYKMAGDWLIYLECLKGGKIAHDVNTNNYFRRHSASQVHKVEGTDIYFAERKAITDYVVENYNVSQRLLKKSFGAIDHEWQRFKYKHQDKVQEDLYDKQEIKSKTQFIVQQPHVAFYVHGMTFSKGGIERLAAQLANYLVENGWQVTIYCRHYDTDIPVYPLYESIQIVRIFDEHKIDQSVIALRSHLLHSDIDVFVPMLSEWLFEPIVEAAQHTGIPIIASEHNDPWKIEELWWSHESRKSCFEKVDGIHLLLPKYQESLPESQQHKISIIPNGVHIPEHVSFENRENLIVSVGRLEPQKRFDRLIEAASLIKDTLKQQNYRIEIYGEGSLYNALQNQIKELNVDDLVFLKGKTSQIEQIYQKADFFVLASEFEGLPVTLLEAFSFGLPAIGFIDCNGPNEIIRQDKDGHLVQTIEELALIIKKYCETDDLAQLRVHAIYRARMYSLEHFFSKWEKLLKLKGSNLLDKNNIKII